MQEQEKQEYYFIKSEKYIATIQDLSDPSSEPCDNHYGFHKYSHHFKIISIEDIFGIYYDEVNDFYLGTYNDDSFLPIKYKIEKNQIFNITNINTWYYINKNDGFYDGFIEEQQWRLFPNGYSNFCSFNYTKDIKIECFINNGKLIGSFKWFEYNILKYEFNFDNFDTTGIATYIRYKINGDMIDKINYSKQELIYITTSRYTKGLFNLIVKLEYFS